MAERRLVSPEAASDEFTSFRDAPGPATELPAMATIQSPPGASDQLTLGIDTPRSNNLNAGQSHTPLMRTHTPTERPRARHSAIPPG